MTFDTSTLFAVFFYAFAGLLVISALRVITARNTVFGFGILLRFWSLDAPEGRVLELGSDSCLRWRRDGALLVCGHDARS
ncbi:MAG: hypothetical protein RL551_1569 [Pseudomonadota bacterium]